MSRMGGKGEWSVGDLGRLGVPVAGAAGKRGAAGLRGGGESSWHMDMQRVVPGSVSLCFRRRATPHWGRSCAPASPRFMLTLPHLLACLMDQQGGACAAHQGAVQRVI